MDRSRANANDMNTPQSNVNNMDRPVPNPNDMNTPMFNFNHMDRPTTSSNLQFNFYNRDSPVTNAITMSTPTFDFNSMATPKTTTDDMDTPQFNMENTTTSNEDKIVIEKPRAADWRTNRRERLTKEQQKANHIDSEKRRRQEIRKWHDRLADVSGIPGQGASEAKVYQHASNKVRELVRERKQLLEEISQAGVEPPPESLLDAKFYTNEFEEKDAEAQEAWESKTKGKGKMKKEDKSKAREEGSEPSNRPFQ